MAPEPIDIIKITFSNSEDIPIDWSIGAVIAQVVTIATVDEPCIVFNIAAKIKTEKILAIPVTLFKLKLSIIPDSRIIYPNAPPAPVINKIPKEFFKDLINHSGVSFILSFLTLNWID